MRIGKFEVNGRSGIIRRKIFDFFPFWQNTKVKLSLTVEALEDVNRETIFACYIRYPNREESEPCDVKLPAMKKGQKRSYNTAPFVMWYTGDAFLNVRDNMLEKPVYAFHVTDRSWMGLAILAGVLAGVFGTLGSWLITLTH